MRSILVVLFCLAFVAQSHKLRHQFQQVLTQIKDKTSDTEWGTTFHSLLELSLQHTKTSELLAKLQALKDQLYKDGQSADAVFQQKSAKFENDIITLQTRLETQQNEQRAANLAVGDIDTELASLLSTQSSQRQQLQQLSQREEDIRNGNAKDEESFNHRQAANNRVIDALNQIIVKLTEAVFNNKKAVLTEIEKKEVVNKLQDELGHNNPLTMLVSLTTKFDSVTVGKIIERLEKLRDSVQAGLIKDEADKQEADSRYQSVLFDIKEVRERLQADVINVGTLINRRKNERAVAVQTLKQLEFDVPLATSTLAKTQQEYGIVNQAYVAEKQGRSKEFELISHAYDLIYQAQEDLEQAEKANKK